MPEKVPELCSAQLYTRKVLTDIFAEFFTLDLHGLELLYFPGLLFVYLFTSTRQNIEPII